MSDQQRLAYWFEEMRCRASRDGIDKCQLDSDLRASRCRRLHPSESSAPWEKASSRLKELLSEPQKSGLSHRPTSHSTMTRMTAAASRRWRARPLCHRSGPALLNSRSGEANIGRRKPMPAVTV